MTDTQPTLEERMKQAQGIIPISFTKDQSAPPMPDTLTDTEHKKDKTALESNDLFFNENMSAEELQHYLAIATNSNGGKSTIKMNNGTTIRVESEAKEKSATKEQSELITPSINENADINFFKEQMGPVNIYLEGTQMTEEEAEIFIDENKAEFIVACNRLFSNMDTIMPTNEESVSYVEPVIFFHENMSAKELLYFYEIGVYNSNNPVIVDIDNNGKKLQLEGIKEIEDKKNVSYNKIDSSKVGGHMNGICVYIDGKQVDAHAFTDFINKNKTEFVAVCNRLFPNMAEIVLAKQKELTIAEKEHILKTVEHASTNVAVKQKPATENELTKSKRLSYQMQQAALAIGREEMRYAQDHLYDSGPRVNVQLYILDRSKVNVIEFSKFTSKDGKEKTSMKLNGRYTNDREMADFLSKNPGQIKQQVDAFLESQKFVVNKKKEKKRTNDIER